MLCCPSLPEPSSQGSISALALTESRARRPGLSIETYLFKPPMRFSLPDNTETGKANCGHCSGQSPKSISQTVDRRRRSSPPFIQFWFQTRAHVNQRKVEEGRPGSHAPAEPPGQCIPASHSMANLPEWIRSTSPSERQDRAGVVPGDARDTGSPGPASELRPPSELLQASDHG